MYDERTAIKVQSRADYEREMEAIEAAKINVNPTLGTAPATARFLRSCGLMPHGLASQCEADARLLPSLIASGYKLELHRVDAAFAATTMSTDQKFQAKARLIALGLL